jgi:ribosomal protein L15
MLTLSNLPKTVIKQSRRIGRGIGSGKGKNSGHGHKGQIKRNGGRKATVGFEGGHASLIKRIPKYRGYNNTGKKNWDLVILTTASIARNFESNDLINLEKLLQKDLVKPKTKRVRIIKNGDSEGKIFTFSDEVYLTKGAKEISNQQQSDQINSDITISVKKSESNIVDDLKKIEGIGPKIEKLLHDNNIKTFLQLSKMTSEDLDKILDSAGGSFASHKSTTPIWSKQAKLASKDKWEELKILQDNLNGGIEK